MHTASPVVNSLGHASVGLWRSWERASMASRRSWVRIPSAPPNFKKNHFEGKYLGCLLYGGCREAVQQFEHGRIHQNRHQRRRQRRVVHLRRNQSRLQRYLREDERKLTD